MNAFFKSPFYLYQTEGDWMLYRAANRSLDLTIDQLGRSIFEKHLEAFVEAQMLANAMLNVEKRYTSALFFEWFSGSL